VRNIERAVAEHYGDAELLGRILEGLEASGANIDRLQPDDLAPVEEFHIGGRKATAHALSKLALSKESHVLDVGCGIGGAVRYLAENIGCRVSGIDLTPEYIDVARMLTDRTDLSDKVSFKVASALAIPFKREIFDAAITLHAAMNIADRTTLYSEIARVMKPDATLCIYDVMRKSGEDLTFPVPWAQTPETSHLVTPEDMRTLLERAGFEVREVEDRTDFALDFFAQSLGAASDGPPPLGIHIVMGATAREKFRNTLSNIERGRIAPVQMIARRNATLA